jgi:hypothetical protein
MRLGELLALKGVIDPVQHQELEARIAQRRVVHGSDGVCEILGKMTRSERVRDQCEAVELARVQLLEEPGLVEALQAAYTRRAILFAGAGFSMSSSHGLTGADLRERIISRLSTSTSTKADSEWIKNEPLASLAQILAAQDAPATVTQIAAQLCRERLPIQPLAHHQSLARINCFRFIVTTNWDRLIEAAYGAGQCNVIRESRDVSNIRYDAVNIVKLHGDYDYAKRDFVIAPRITAQDISALSNDEPALFSFLQSLILTQAIIVVGFQPDDTNFLHLIESASRHLSPSRPRVYLIDPQEVLHRHLLRADVTPIRCDALDFIDALESYAACAGGRIGQSRDVSPTRFGAIRLHSRDMCETADLVRAAIPSLKRVAVVDASQWRGEPDFLRRAKQAVGGRAAELLRELSFPGARLTLSCGSTLEAVATSASSDWRSLAGAQLYSASVPILDLCSSSGPLGLSTMLAGRLAALDVKGKAYQLPAAFLGYLIDDDLREYVGLPEANETIRSAARDLRQSMNKYFEEAAQADIFLLGVGAVGHPDSFGLEAYARACVESAADYNPTYKAERAKRFLTCLRTDEGLGFVGEIAYRLFRPVRTPTEPAHALSEAFMQKGRLLKCLANHLDSPSFAEFLVRVVSQVQSIDLSALALAAIDNSRSSIVAAAGAHKALAVLSVCNARLVDTIVIDSDLANDLLLLA